jgi:hypothetical protein
VSLPLYYSACRAVYTLAVIADTDSNAAQTRTPIVEHLTQRLHMVY